MKIKNTQPHNPTRQRQRNVVLTMVCKGGQTEHQPVTMVTVAQLPFQNNNSL
ncbi:MAG: hypothetical protein M9898_14605 [Chitinophagaceae bacterium]|nr:hypothetical protein [Chitinophagaceae bacterium]